MKNKMSPRRAEDCKELKSILNDNRVNTIAAKNRDYYNFANCNKWDQYNGYFKGDEVEASKCLKRNKEFWRGDKAKKLKFDFVSSEQFKEFRSVDESEITLPKTGRHCLHTKAGFFPSASCSNEGTISASTTLDIGISSPLNCTNPSESEIRCNKTGGSIGSYSQNHGTTSYERLPDCTFSSTNGYLPHSLSTNIHGDSGTLNDYYYNYYYYHHYCNQQQQHYINPSTTNGLNNYKETGYAWDYLEPVQFNSHPYFGVKSLPAFDWSQHGDQWYAWPDRVDQYTTGESGLYYPFCHAPPCYGSDAPVHKNPSWTKMDPGISRQKTSSRRPPFASGHEVCNSEHRGFQNLQSNSSREDGEASECNKEGGASSISPSSSSFSISSPPTSSVCYKTRDIDSTWSPSRDNRSAGKYLGERVLDLRTCLPAMSGRAIPRNWLAVDKTLVENLIDTIMTGNGDSTNDDNSGANYCRNDNVAHIGSKYDIVIRDEETRLAVL